MVALMLWGHPWWATVALFGVMLAQKLLGHADRWRVVVALAWFAAAAAVAGSALFD